MKNLRAFILAVLAISLLASCSTGYSSVKTKTKNNKGGCYWSATIDKDETINKKIESDGLIVKP